MRFVQLFMFKVGIDQITNIVVGFLFPSVLLVTLALLLGVSFFGFSP